MFYNDVLCVITIQHPMATFPGVGWAAEDAQPVVARYSTTGFEIPIYYWSMPHEGYWRNTVRWIIIGPAGTKQGTSFSTVIDNTEPEVAQNLRNASTGGA
jgi:hypothetical protein